VDGMKVAIFWRLRCASPLALRYAAGDGRTGREGFLCPVPRTRGPLLGTKRKLTGLSSERRTSYFQRINLTRYNACPDLGEGNETPFQCRGPAG
jgi:hypothetical protein